jgi:malate dehydrogenase
LLDHYGHKIQKKFTGLLSLDYNRANYLLAKTCETTTDKIKNLIVWKNHSDSQFLDVFHCKIDGRPIQELFAFNPDWLHTNYVESIANRWKKIVEYTGGTRYISF